MIDFEAHTSTPIQTSCFPGLNCVPYATIWDGRWPLPRQRDVSMRDLSRINIDRPKQQCIVRGSTHPHLKTRIQTNLQLRIMPFKIEFYELFSGNMNLDSRFLTECVYVCRRGWTCICVYIRWPSFISFAQIWGAEGSTTKRRECDS